MIMTYVLGYAHNLKKSRNGKIEEQKVPFAVVSYLLFSCLSAGDEREGLMYRLSTLIGQESQERERERESWPFLQPVCPKPK